MHACVDTCRLTVGIERVQRARSARRRALPPTCPRRCCERGTPAQNEAAQHLSAVRAFYMGPSTGNGTDLPPLPVDATERVACNAEPRREASRAVCSDFRKSKPFHTEMIICRCNASQYISAFPRRKSRSERPGNWHHPFCSKRGSVPFLAGCGNRCVPMSYVNSVSRVVHIKKNLWLT